MYLNEKFKQFPIKFYKKPDGTIFYDCKFLTGTANTMEDAFKIFSENNWDKDLIWYYDDVIDVQFGTFEPAYTDKKYKGMLYLGKLNLQLDVDPKFGDEKRQVTYLSKHPEAHEQQAQFIKDLKRDEKIEEFRKKLEKGFKKVAGIFTKQYEMFFPEKTRYDLICEHCGEIIPVGNYYEEYQKKNYHIECMWDMFYNKDSKDFEDCRKYFLSLQQIEDWPANGLDIQEDYLTDLELVKSNIRRNK